MRKLFLFLHTTILLFIYFSGAGSSLTEYHSPGNPKQIKWAFIMGISDFMDPGITSISTAANDAHYMAEYLRTPEGGSLDDQHLKLLINENASIGKIISTLDQLVESTTAGDQILIYISTYYLNSTRFADQPGYLLAWNSYLNDISSSAIPNNYLDQVISKFEKKGTKVILLTDVIHPPAFNINPSVIKNTFVQFSDSHSNVSVLSACKTSEFNMPSRFNSGLQSNFNYHLIDALYGMADYNKDGSVNLAEVNKYLQEQYSKEMTALKTQTPEISGNKAEVMSKFNSHVLNNYLKNKKKPETTKAKIIFNKLIEPDYFKNDTAFKLQWNQYSLALQQHRFFTAGENSAEYYYSKWLVDSTLLPRQNIIREKYIQTLLDQQQEEFNIWLLRKIENQAESLVRMPASLKPELDKLKLLLGEQHGMYPAVNARWHFIVANEQNSLYNSTGDPSRIDSAVVHYRLALESLPHHIICMNDLAMTYLGRGEQDEALKLLEQVVQLQPQNANAWKGMYFIYAANKESDQSVNSLKELMRSDPDYFIGNLFAEKEFFNTDFLEGILKGIEIDSTYSMNYAMAGLHQLANHEYKESEKYFMKAMSKKADDLTSAYGMALLKTQQRKFTEAIPYLEFIHNKIPKEISSLSFALALSGKANEGVKLSGSHTLLSSREHYNYILSLQEDSRWEEAEKELNHWKELLPNDDDSRTYYYLALCRQQIIAGKSEAAASAIQHSLVTIQPLNRNLKWWIFYSIHSDPAFDQFIKQTEIAKLLDQQFPWKF
jgi:hypothetical protein